MTFIFRFVCLRKTWYQQTSCLYWKCTLGKNNRTNCGKTPDLFKSLDDIRNAGLTAITHLCKYYGDLLGLPGS